MQFFFKKEPNKNKKISHRMLLLNRIGLTCGKPNYHRSAVVWLEGWDFTLGFFNPKGLKELPSRNSV